MASTCPINTTTGRPTFGGYPFETTGCPTGYPMPNWFYEPSSKYASIFNKDTTCPTSMPVTPFPSTYPSTFEGFNTYNPWTMKPTTTPFECNTPFYPNNMPSTWNSWPMTYPRPMNNFYNMPCPPTTYPWTWPMNTTYTGYPWTTGYPTMTGVPTPFNYPTTNWWWNNFSNVAFRPSNQVEFYCLTNPIRVLDREGNRCIYLCFDLRGYKPEEVTVTMNKTERCIIVEATHDVKDKEYAVMRKFYRKFVLPETLAKIDLAKCELKSCFTTEGMLTIECTLPKMTTEEIAKCPVMTRSTIYGNGPFCPSNCASSPVTVKVC